jgi:tubulin beta
MQAGQCSNQMGTQFWEVLCDEHGIGGDCEYCGDNDAQLDRISVLCHEVPGGKYVTRVVFFEPGVIDAVRASPLAEFLSSLVYTPHMQRGTVRIDFGSDLV